MSPLASNWMANQDLGGYLRERGLTAELWRQELRESLIMEALLEQQGSVAAAR